MIEETFLQIKQIKKVYKMTLNLKSKQNLLILDIIKL